MKRIFWAYLQRFAKTSLGMVGMLFLLSSTACSLASMFTPHQQQTAPTGPAPMPLQARFQLIDGIPKTLADYKGKVIYVDFWASWCAPCRQSMPYYADLQQHYSGKDFAFVAIGLDEDPDKVREFAQRWNLPFDVGSDGFQEAARAFSVNQLPTSFILDKLGRVRFVHRGFNPKRISRLEEEIDILLTE